MKLEFELRRSYGHQRFYPMNVAAQAIANIAGRVCIGQDDITLLKMSGFDVRITLGQI